LPRRAGAGGVPARRQARPGGRPPAGEGAPEAASALAAALRDRHGQGLANAAAAGPHFSESKTQTFAVRATDLDTGQVVWEWRRPTGVPCSAVAFSPDGARFALGGPDRLEVCDAATGKPTFTVSTCAEDVAWAPAGNRIATCTSALADEVSVWSAEDGSLIH